MKPSLEKTYLDICEVLSRRSPHPTVKVGCVVVSGDLQEVYSVGYNGMEAGGVNELDSFTPGESGTIHAETNALLKVRTPRESTKILFVSHSPCKECARMIINSGGFKKVVYQHDYRNQDGVALLLTHGIEVEKR